MAIELVYETHSTTVDNEAGIATGWREGRLSEAGRAQATALGERRHDDGRTFGFAATGGSANATTET